MSKNNYDVFPKNLETIDYRILVLSLPENELEDLLTHFITERGNISKSLYEDFLIANCIGNLNQFMAHVQNISAKDSLDLIKLREEVTNLILEHNPLLEPDNIVINKNKVLKLKPKKGKEEDDIFLTENTYWDKSYYDENGNYNPISNKSKNSMKKPSSSKKENKKEKDINELEYDKVQVWWDRLNEYISIKKYSTEDIDFILTQRYFHNSTSFNTYIVSNCVLDVEDIYERIDGMGVNVDPNVIIRELFGLCVNVNEGISYTRAKELQPDDVEDDETDQKGSSKAQKAYSKSKFNTNKKKKKKPSFKEVKKEELMQLAGNMKLSLIGQDEAVSVLTEAVKRASVGLKDPIKPIGSFLFAGKTGCGKTLTTKVLADELIKTKKNRVVIDCSEYSSDHEYAKLIGAPSGYIGHDNGGVLTNAVLEDPFSVVVFDEIEKASSKVYDLLLQILDEGRLTDGRGQSVSFKDTIVIMTSNIGVDEIESVTKTIGFGDVAVLTEDKKVKALDKAMKKKFKPELLNRIDTTVHFKDLSEEDYMRIIDIELYKLSENLKFNDTEYKDLVLNFDDEVKRFIYENGVDEKYGARPIKRTIEKHISNKIASTLLEEEYSPNSSINVTMEDDEIKLDVIDNEEEAHNIFMHGTEG